MKTIIVYLIIEKKTEIIKYVGVDTHHYDNDYYDKKMIKKNFQKAPHSLRRHWKTNKNPKLKFFLKNDEWYWKKEYDFNNKKKAHKQERELISEFKPKYNKYGTKEEIDYWEF